MRRISLRRFAQHDKDAIRVINLGIRSPLDDPESLSAP
jgi:hypothetical protein